MNRLLLATSLSLAAASASAQQYCTFYPSSGGALARPAELAPELKADAESAIGALTVAQVTAPEAQRIEQGSVLLEMNESGMWQLRPRKEDSDDSLAATSTLSARRTQLKSAQKPMLLSAVRMMLRQSLSSGHQFNVVAQGPCWN
jgi:hypothetical protein